MAVPRASVLLLRQAEKHLRRAQKLRGQLAAQIVRRQWTQPGFEQAFSNEELLFDFFEEAMSGIVLAHASLDNFANESLPSEFVFTDETGKTWTREDIERWMGLEKRLQAVLSAATGRPDLARAKQALFERAMVIKDLRDDIGHSKLATAYTGPADAGLDQTRIDGTIFSRLLAHPLDAAQTVSDIIEHYAGPVSP
jgi:hypothetical protein